MQIVHFFSNLPFQCHTLCLCILTNRMSFCFCLPPGFVSQMFKIQSEWYSLSVVILLLSFGTWIGVAYIVSGARSIDPDFYFVSQYDVLQPPCGTSCACSVPFSTVFC